MAVDLGDSVNMWIHSDERGMVLVFAGGGGGDGDDEGVGLAVASGGTLDGRSPV